MDAPLRHVDQNGSFGDLSTALLIFLRTPYDSDVLKYYLGGIGALSMSLECVGLVIAVNGVASVGVQAIIYPAITTWLGTGPTLRLATSLHPWAYIFLPYIAFIPAGTWRFIGLFTLLNVTLLLQHADATASVYLP